MSNLGDWYEHENYERIYYSGVSGWVSREFHKLIERDRTEEYKIVLEVGSTHGQHLGFVKHKFEEYLLTDIVISPELQRLDNLPKVKVLQMDVTNMDKINSGSVDRLISTCLLHHLQDPELALMEIKRVLNSNGVADILVPNDPSLLWNTGRTLLTFPRARLQGWRWRDYWHFVRIDHINHIKNIKRLILLHSEIHALNLKVEKFPFNWLPSSLTAYYRFTLSKTDILS